MTRARRPDPPPLEVNEIKIAAVGTVAWAVALAVLFLVGLPPENRWWLWVCVAGIVIGANSLWFIPWLHTSQARKEAIRAAQRRAALQDGAQGDETPDNETRATAQDAERDTRAGANENGDRQDASRRDAAG
ncbi:MAG TPA: DUF2530 domain-containing protein [Spirillospora sp.]